MNRERALNRALNRLGSFRVGRRVPFLALTDAVYGWGNEGWSADEDYLLRLMSEAATAKGAIVECGSGLSTLLLAGVARQSGTVVHSLEHNADWRKRVMGELAARGLTNYSTVHHAPLQKYGEYDWYSIPQSLPGNIALVICDGPPSDTLGGRHGVLPALRDRMAPTCTILMDDANRPSEIEIMALWERDFKTVSERYRTIKGFARVTVAS
jgi:methyltransferase family protein